MSRANVIQGVFPRGFSHVTAAIQPKAANGRPAVVQRTPNAIALPPQLAPPAARGGQPLQPAVRQKMESLLRADFADVRVHVGTEPQRLGALAFTQGSNIYFSPGYISERSLAHELVHVLQQRSGSARNPFGGGVAVLHDPRLEAEAARLSGRVATGPGTVQPFWGKLAGAVSLGSAGAYAGFTYGASLGSVVPGGGTLVGGVVGGLVGMLAGHAAERCVAPRAADDNEQSDGLEKDIAELLPLYLKLQTELKQLAAFGPTAEQKKSSILVQVDSRVRKLQNAPKTGFKSTFEEILGWAKVGRASLDRLKGSIPAPRAHEERKKAAKPTDDVDEAFDLIEAFGQRYEKRKQTKRIESAAAASSSSTAAPSQALTYTQVNQEADYLIATIDDRIQLRGDRQVDPSRGGISRADKIRIAQVLAARYHKIKRAFWAGTNVYYYIVHDATGKIDITGHVIAGGVDRSKRNGTNEFNYHVSW